MLMHHFSVVAVLIVLAVGCSDSGKPIEFVLPNDFTGEFRLVKDSANGVALTERNGVWVFEVPETGVLRVKQDWPFYRWHKEIARYVDGRGVGVEDMGTRAGTRSTGPDSSEGSTDYDGTTHIWRVR